MSGSVACSKRARPWNQCRLLSAIASLVVVPSIEASAVAVTLLVAFSTARGAVALSVQLGRREVVGAGASCGGRAPLVSTTDRWREKGWDNPSWKVRANVGADTSTCRFRWRLASSSVPASLHEQLQVGRCEENHDPPPPSLDREVASVATPKQSSAAAVEASMCADTVTESEALQEAVLLQLPPEPRILPTSPTVSAVDSSVVECSQNEQHQQSQQRKWPKRQSITVDGRTNLSSGRRWTPPRNSSVRSSRNIDIGRNDITSGNQIPTLSGISSRGTNILNNYNVNRNRTRSVTTINSSKEDIKKRRDNEVRMFLLERGLSQEEVRKILPVTRRDPRLMSDIGVLAAKMQAIADLLQSAASWFPPAADTGSGGGTGKIETVDGRAMCARLSAYQLISSEPRLLLLDVEPALKCRLRFLLSLFPWLLDHRWDEARLLKAAPLLAITSTTLQGRYQRLVELLPREVDVQAMVCQVPLLLGRSSEGVSETLDVTQELIPGIQLKRVLRHAPQLLAQPKWVVQRRLATLREMLGLDMSSLPGNEKTEKEHRQPTGSNGSNGADNEQRPRTTSMTLTRFANLFPRILVMNPHTLRVKLEGLERLLTGLDAAALVRSRPSLLGFNVRTNLSTKVSRLRVLLGPDVDLSTAVARCPSLLSMGSITVAAKVKTLQESLPPGLDIRHVIAKEPRVLSLDAASTVPRKMGDLARAFSEHAEADADQTAAMMAQVLKYNPNALRYDSDNVAGKIMALREAGLPAAVVRSIVRDAPRCLSAAAGTLVERVSILEKAFPSVPAARLLEGAPCLLQKHIAPETQVSLLGELFPFAEPVSLVEKAPMLLALGENTLRVKTDTWRHVLEPRVDVSWEETISLVPRILCQGLGRAARIAYLRDPSAPPRAAPGGSVEGHGADTLTAGKALNEVCRRAADFARDYPSYPSFLYSLLAETTSGVGADGMNASRSSYSLSPDEEWSNFGNGACSDGEKRFTGFRGVAGASSSPLGRGDVGIGGQEGDRARASPVGRIDAGLVGDRRQRHHWQQWRQLRRRDQNALPPPTEASTTARGGRQRSTMSATPAGAGPQLSPPTATAGSCTAAVSVGDDALLASPAASSRSGAEACKGGEENPFELSAEEEYDLVAAERALGAVMCAMTREAGGREASAMLLLVPRTGDAVERNGSLTAYRSTGARL